MQKRGGGEFPVHHHVGRETGAEQLDRSAQQTLSGRVFAIARSVGFDIKREAQPRPHHAGEDQVVSIAHDLLIGIAMGTAQ